MIILVSCLCLNVLVYLCAFRLWFGLLRLCCGFGVLFVWNYGCELVVYVINSVAFAVF